MELNDVVFTFHAVLLTAFTIVQCCIYQVNIYSYCVFTIVQCCIYQVNMYSYCILTILQCCIYQVNIYSYCIFTILQCCIYQVNIYSYIHQSWKWVTGSVGHGSNGSQNLSGSLGSRINLHDPLTHHDLKITNIFLLNIWHGM